MLSYNQSSCQKLIVLLTIILALKLNIVAEAEAIVN